MKQFPIVASIVDTQVLPMDPKRLYLHIRNYAASGQTMWVAFGQAATPGANGELEIVPGSEYIWGNALGNAPGKLLQHNLQESCPTDAIHIVTSTGTALGCALVTAG